MIGWFNAFIYEKKYSAVRKSWVKVMVFNVTFNDISAILWWSVLLVEETRVHRENYQPATCHWQTLSHNVKSDTLPWMGFELTTFVVIGTDCIVVVNPIAIWWPHYYIFKTKIKTSMRYRYIENVATNKNTISIYLLVLKYGLTGHWV
jgi:hypothetical protein